MFTVNRQENIVVNANLYFVLQHETAVEEEWWMNKNLFSSRGPFMFIPAHPINWALKCMMGFISHKAQCCRLITHSAWAVWITLYSLWWSQQYIHGCLHTAHLWLLLGRDCVVGDGQEGGICGPGGCSDVGCSHTWRGDTPNIVKLHWSC